MRTTSFKINTIVLFFFLIISNSFSQTVLLSKKAKISVLTCGLGNKSYSLFGHTALRVTDPETNLDIVYNYGMFDFNTPNFVAKFAKGDLQYYVNANSYADFIYSYNYEKRSVYEQELLLTDNIKQQLFNNLNNTLLSENRFYTYKFIDKNCTSMIVDIINKSLNETVITKKEDTNKTYRTILYPYFDNHFYEKLGVNIIFGIKVDELGTKVFLPFELKNSLEKTIFQEKPLARESKTLISFEKETPTSWWNNCYTYLVLLVFIIFINKKPIDTAFLLIMGLLGVFFIIMGFYSSHKELANNYNMLLFNPILLILLFFNLLKNKKIIYKLAVFHLILLIIYTLFIINKVSFLIVLPLIITVGVVLVRTALQNKKRIPIII